MNKTKTFLIFILAAFLNIFTATFVFSEEVPLPEYSKNDCSNFYPDYSFEFAGKDSWEGFNRKIFAFNLKANKYIIRPVNVVWASVMPQYGIDRVDSFYTNLNYPTRLVSSLVQKDFETSKLETKRFFTNTTLGFLGLYDVAKSKYKLEPRKEDMEQALAYYNVKQGPYLVVPIIAQGNLRDIGGQILDLPLNPCAYIVGPIAMASTGLSLLNKTTTLQQLYKMADGYADPYEVTRQLNGIDRYIKNANLDRKEVFEAKEASLNIIKISQKTQKSDEKANLSAAVQPDIKLDNYNPQGSEIDSLRTMLFDTQKLGSPTWAELSVWNKSFNKKLKTSSISVDSARPNCKYRYILQKDKKAPLAVIYPSIGEGIMSNQSAVFGKILYDEGYSVVVQGSPFNWEIVKSMPSGYKPGMPAQDAKYLRLTTAKILNELQSKKKCNFSKKILVGTSFGGMTTLFVAAQEEKDNTLGFSNYISVNPPIELFYALSQLDKYCQNWKNNPSDIKLDASVAAKKIIQVSLTDYNKDSQNSVVSLPFNQDQAELAISFAMKLKLYNLIFAIENGSFSKKNDLYETTNNMSFYNYAEKYLLQGQNKPLEQLKTDASMYNISDFLKNEHNYKIYHSLNDCFTNPKQLSWLKKQTGKNTVLFDNGSHLGFLYRKEFLDEFKKDIKFQKSEL